MSDVKLQRTLARFQAKIDGGAFYEAHQTLRTIINRNVKSKQYKDAVDLLYQGASILAVKKEYASSSDLILYLIQVLGEAGFFTKEYKYKIIELVNLIPDTESSLNDLAKQSIAWSKKGLSTSKFGDGDLHHTFGVKLANAVIESTGIDEEERFKMFANAELHLILGTHESLVYYVNFLSDWFKNDKSSNEGPGLFIARAVYNYAYLKNYKFVQDSLQRFIDSIRNDLTVSEIDNVKLYDYKGDQLFVFLQLLVLTLGKDATAGTKFLKLYSQYKNLLAENNLLAPTEYLGREYFDLKLGNANGGNMLANLMGGLFK